MRHDAATLPGDGGQDRMRGSGMGGGVLGGGVMTGQRRANWRDELNAAIAKEAAEREAQLNGLREIVRCVRDDDWTLNEQRYRETQQKLDTLRRFAMQVYIALGLVLLTLAYQAVTR